MNRCGGVIDVPALEHALQKAKDQLAKVAPQNERARKKLAGQVHDLAQLLDGAKALMRMAEKREAAGG